MIFSLSKCIFSIFSIAFCALSTNDLPHIMFFLTDDLGYNAPGYKNQDVISPTLDALRSNGVELTDHHTYRFCAPSRSSFLSGRFPYKLAATRVNFNPAPLMDGLHLSYMTIADQLQKIGYSTHQFGKWHQGFYHKEYTPLYRGFNTSYGFLTGGESHYTEETITSHSCGGEVDIWDTDHPAVGDNGTWSALLFTEAAKRVIASYSSHHNNTRHQNTKQIQYTGPPLFFYFALHDTHGPTEAPLHLVNKYPPLPGNDSAIITTFNAMISGTDESVKNITDALKTAGMWNNTLLIWTSDNGAEITHQLSTNCYHITPGKPSGKDHGYCAGGSNAPFRGGKGSNWEGGHRVPTFISGPALPSSMRGKTLDGLAHISDWYKTLVEGVASGDASDPRGVSPLDSINLWPWLSGHISSSPRKFIVHDHHMFGNEIWGAVRLGKWKLIVHSSEGQASWYGRFTPNATTPNPSFPHANCSTSQPCLFNIEVDPTEHHNVAIQNPTVVHDLMTRFQALEKEYHPPKKNPSQDVDGYCEFVKNNHGFLGPWKTGDLLKDHKMNNF